MYIIQSPYLLNYTVTAVEIIVTIQKKAHLRFSDGASEGRQITLFYFINKF